jgi:hypothetical protein
MQKKFVRVNVPHSMLSFPSATLFAVGEIDRERLCGWVERVRRRRAAVHATYDHVSASWLTVRTVPQAMHRTIERLPVESAAPISFHPP